MSRSTSSSLQTGIEKSVVETTPQPAADNMVKKDPSGLKTSNLQIFPSLHPLSNFHRAKADIITPPLARAPKLALSDPVKKIKTNEKTEKIVQEITISSPEPLKEEEKTEKNLASSPKSDDEFKVPKLPSRLNAVVPKKQIKETKLSPKAKDATEESLVVSDPVMNILNALTGEKNDSIKKMAELYKSQLAKEQMKRKIFEYLRWLDNVQSQGHLLLDLGVESELCDEPSEEVFLYDHLRQNISEMMSVCQRSQERLAEFLKH